MAKEEPETKLLVTVATPEASVKMGSDQVATAELAPTAALTVWDVGQLEVTGPRLSVAPVK